MSRELLELGELRSLLQQPPSAQVWEAICALVGPLAAEKTVEQWLPYAQDHLDRRWPDSLRRLPAAWRERARPPSAVALARVVQLYSPSAQTWDEIVRLLTPHPPLITALEVRLGYPPAQPEALAALLDELEALEINAHQRWDGLWRALVAAGRVTRLRRLLLTLSPSAGESAEVLCALVAAPRQLEALTLSVSHTRRGEALCEAVAAHAATLETLCLQHTPLTEEALGRLSEPRWERLGELDLRNTRGRAGALARLYGRLPALRRLYACPDPDNAAALDVLAASSLRLESLSLRDGYRVEPPAVAGLLTSPVTHALCALDLHMSRVDARSAHALAYGPASQTLERLDLGASVWLDGAWDALIGAHMPALELLDLYNVELTESAAAALASLRAPRLKTVNLAHARASGEALAVLSRAGWLPQITCFVTESHYVEHPVARHMASAQAAL